MDTQTRHALKKDKFAQAAASSASWLSGHRSGAVRWSIAGAVVIVLAIASLITWNIRTSAADNALGAALDIYNAPLAVPGEPAQSGVYATAAERAKAANALFTSAAQKYNLLKAGQMARYFAGITAEDLGQTAEAESDLKQVAGSWDHNLANLAKVALANLDHQNGHDSQAVELYNQIIAKPSTTVSASVAQLDLADLYAAEGKQDQARALWAKVQDADKQGAAGEIAASKLSGKQ